MLTSTNHRQGEYSQFSSDLLRAFFRFSFWSDFALFCILGRYREMFGIRSHNCSFTFENNFQCAQFSGHGVHSYIHCTRNTVHCTLYTVHCTLYTHTLYTIPNVQSTLCTFIHTLYTLSSIYGNLLFLGIKNTSFRMLRKFVEIHTKPRLSK